MHKIMLLTLSAALAKSKRARNLSVSFAKFVAFGKRGARAKWRRLLASEQRDDEIFAATNKEFKCFKFCRIVSI